MTPANNKVPSLLNEQYLHGNDDESIAKSIKLGYPEKEMPPWGAALSDKDIRSMVIYIREQQFLFKRGQIKIEKLAETFTGKTEHHNFQANTWVGDLIEPWSLAFLGADKALVTEKLGMETLEQEPQPHDAGWRREEGPGATEAHRIDFPKIVIRLAS
jgi:hypothetical protein